MSSDVAGIPDTPTPPVGRPRRVPFSVTRVVLVDANGGYVERWAVGWDVHIQDDGRTLKLFPREGDVKPILDGYHREFTESLLAAVADYQAWMEVDRG